MALTKEIQIVNELGMHARAAAKFVKEAGRFSCSIRVSKDGMEIDGKSIMGLMMLAAAKGTSIIVTADGGDETDAISALEELINDKFGEDA